MKIQPYFGNLADRDSNQQIVPYLSEVSMLEQHKTATLSGIYECTGVKQTTTT